jgi:hypothetical protein
MSGFNYNFFINATVKEIDVGKLKSVAAHKSRFSKEATIGYKGRLPKKII